jgi:hypothetical protein
MARAEQQQEEGEPETAPYPRASDPAAAPQHHPELPAQRNRDSARHGSFD